MVSKAQERIYAESAIRLLSVNWQLVDIQEPPDFEVRENGLSFGLEIRQVFADGEQNFGSSAKRKESQNSRIISSLAKHYYALGGPPISVQLLGPLSTIDIAAFSQELASISPSQLDGVRVEHIQGVKVFVRPLPLDWLDYSRWRYVDDKAGWVRNATSHELQKAINRKQGNLALYKQKYENIDLLLVADRIFNSGKLQGCENLQVANPGFRTIYFMSYPESIQRVD